MTDPTRRSLQRLPILLLAIVMLLATSADAHDFGEEGQGGGPAEIEVPARFCPTCTCPTAPATGGSNKPQPASPGGGSESTNTAGLGDGAQSGNTCSMLAADPVETFTGRFRYEHVDLALNGVFPIRIVRRYDSQSAYDSPLGYGWSFDHDVRLYEYPNGWIVIRGPWGERDVYNQTGPTEYALADDARGRAGVLSAEGTGHELTYPSGHVAVFDAEGLLTEIRDPQGNKLVMTYFGGDPPLRYDLHGTSPYSPTPSAVGVVARTFRLERIEEKLKGDISTGRYVTFEYDDANGRLDLIRTFDHRIIDYTHSAEGNLTAVEDPAFVVYTYKYEDPLENHNLTWLQEGEGTTQTVNDYDAEDRVEAQYTGDPLVAEPRWIFEYEEDEITGERTSTVTRRIVDDAGGNKRFATTTYRFNSWGHVIQKIDALGNRLTYARTDAAGSAPMEPPQRITITVEPNTGSLETPAYEEIERVVDLYYYGDQNLKNRIVTTNGETITETWTYDHDWVKSYHRKTSRFTEEFLTEYKFYKNGEYPPTNDDLPPENIHSVIRYLNHPAGPEKITTVFTYDPTKGNQLKEVQLPDVDGESLDIVRTYHTAIPKTGLIDSINLQVDDVDIPQLERSFTYDGAAHLDLVTDAESNITDFDFDALGRLTMLTQDYLDKTVDPAEEKSTSTVFTYTGPTDGLTDADLDNPAASFAGNFLTRIERGKTASDGRRSYLVRDGEGRVVRIKRKDTSVMPADYPLFAAFAYDSDGNRVASTDGENRTRRFEYDRMARLISIADAAVPDPNVTTFDYDVLGNRTLVKDAKLRETVFDYDALSRLIEVDVRAEDLQTAFTYDAAGNVRYVDDPENERTTYSYDGLSRLTSVVQPVTNDTVTYEYDARSRLDLVVNARLNILDYSYYGWGGLESVDHYVDQAAKDAMTISRTVSYTYDDNGNVLTAGDDQIGAGPLYSFTYDPQDRVDTVTAHYVPGTSDPVLDIAYNALGDRTGLLLKQGLEELSHGWSFDDLGRLDLVDLPDGVGGALSLDFDYFDNDDLKKITRGTRAVADYTYHPEGPVDAITVKDGALTQRHFLDYDVDEVLNVVSVSERWNSDASQNYSYVYDGADRVTTANSPIGYGLPQSESFKYDSAGNRDDADNPDSFTYEAGTNRIETSPGRGYTFDADGNVDAIDDGDTQNPTVVADFGYDFSNRLQSYTAQGVTSTYRHDPFGRRILKLTDNGSTETYFLWDGDLLLAEYDDTGARKVRYAYAGGFAPVQVAYDDGASGEDVYDVHADHLDTPRMLTDASGAAVWRAAYEAFGEAKLDPGNTLSEDFNIRFPGQYYDEETGLHYNRFRYYDPSIGRYISADPIGQFGGRDANLYRYVWNDPINASDPLGLVGPDTAAGAAIGFFLGGPAGAVLGAAFVTLGGAGACLASESCSAAVAALADATAAAAQTCMNSVADDSSPVDDAVDDLTSGGEVDDKGRVTNIDQTGSDQSASDALGKLADAVGAAPKPSTDGKTTVIDLPGGGTASARPHSKSGPPTVQVNRPGRKPMKVRFPRF